MARPQFIVFAVFAVAWMSASMTTGQTLIYQVPQDGSGVPDPRMIDARPDNGVGDMDQAFQTGIDDPFGAGVLAAANIDGRDVLARNGGDEIMLRTNGALNVNGFTNANTWSSDDTISLQESEVYRASVAIWVPDTPNLGPPAEFASSYPINGGGVEIPLEFNHTGFGVRTDANGEMVLFAHVNFDDYSANPALYEAPIADRFPAPVAQLGETLNNLHIIDMIVDPTGIDPVADFYIDGVAVSNMQDVIMNAARVDQNIVRFGDCCGLASDFNWAIEWFKVEAGVGTPHAPLPPPPIPTAVSWVPDRFGDWNESVNWTNVVVPNNTREAVLGDAISSPRTIINEGTATAKAITFDNANGYSLAGSGIYRLEADSGNAAINVLQAATAGKHQFQGRVQLGSPTTVSTTGAAELEFNDEVDLAGRSLTIQGNVEFNHSVVDSVGTGSISGSGSLGTAGNTSVAGNLTFNGIFPIYIDSQNTDRFSISGTANLTGTISVDVLNSFTPSGAYTIVSAGNLINGGLTLGGPDAGLFSLSVTPGAGGTIQLLATSAGVAGDYNRNGVVDAADYVLWRETDGDAVAAGTGADGDANGVINGADYTFWRARFGNTAASGNGAGAAVPEPGCIALIVFAALIGAARFRRQK